MSPPRHQQRRQRAAETAAEAAKASSGLERTHTPGREEADGNPQQIDQQVADPAGRFSRSLKSPAQRPTRCVATLSSIIVRPSKQLVLFTLNARMCEPSLITHSFHLALPLKIDCPIAKMIDSILFKVASIAHFTSMDTIFA